MKHRIAALLVGLTLLLVSGVSLRYAQAAPSAEELCALNPGLDAAITDTLTNWPPTGYEDTDTYRSLMYFWGTVIKDAEWCQNERGGGIAPDLVERTMTWHYGNASEFMRQYDALRVASIPAATPAAQDQATTGTDELCALNPGLHAAITDTLARWPPTVYEHTDTYRSLMYFWGTVIKDAEWCQNGRGGGIDPDLAERTMRWHYGNASEFMRQYEALRQPATPTPIPTPTPTPTATPAALSFPSMVAMARPSVVRIETSVGNGSGVIFETDGESALVLTNEHVVGYDATVTITVNDVSLFTGTVLGVDATRDLAVVRICCGSFSAPQFGTAELGDSVALVGYPLGIPGSATVTRGVVSAFRYSAERQRHLVQTDAAANPGNSGGPMLNMRGEIVGIVTFLIRETEGINFAVSSQTAEPVANTLKTQAPTVRATPTPQPPPVSFGPEDVEVSHDPSDGHIETYYAGVHVADFEASAIFVNPYAARQQAWSHGMFFRDPHERNTPKIVFTIVAQPDGFTWWRASRLTTAGGWEQPALGEGVLSGINMATGGRNNLFVRANGVMVDLFVNGSRITTLNVGATTYAGDIGVGTGFVIGTERAGAVTRVLNFTVRPLQ